MIISINYANESFRKQQEYNTKTAYEKGGVDKVIEYSPEDIELEFKEKNINIFNYDRGAGLWLWKPYFIVKTLEKMNYGDYLFYCDSGVYYTGRVQTLINAMEISRQYIMAYELPLVSKQWTKGETFQLMRCDKDEYKECNQFLATYILMKKTKETVGFFNELLEHCCNERLISYKIFNSDIKNDTSFIAHREDQSIFSILCTQYGLIPFRDPSQFGSRPWDYYLGKDYIYNPKKHNNSPYPEMLICYRKSSLTKFKMKEFLKKVLSKINIYNAEFQRKRLNR